MKKINDLFADQRSRFEEGRTTLAKIQSIFDTAFGKESCVVKLSRVSMVIYVVSAGMASEVQMQKHLLIKDIQAVEPDIQSVRITIGLPREPRTEAHTEPLM